MKLIKYIYNILDYSQSCMTHASAANFCINDIILSKEICVGNHVLPVGTPVAISSYQMGRNPQIFPDPERIIPERWSRTSHIGPE